MKIAITGHTKGLGLELVNLLSIDHEIIGFSRSNGYDIEKFYDVIVDKSLNCDVFINNAYSSNKQLDIFNRLMTYWGKDLTKTIVNIGSRAKYINYVTASSIYAKNKRTLFDTAIDHVFNTGFDNQRCRILNINPGQIHNTQDQISFTDVAKVIEFALKLPQSVEMGEIGIWSTVYKNYSSN